MTTDIPMDRKGDDRRQEPGGSQRRQGAPQYAWSVSSPSPAEIAELELMFPTVIQVPTETIDREVNDWLAGGLIVRSLFRWVPPEAVIREFRRFGIAGGISSISLSHRFLLLKFEEPAARDAALLQPWVVNGQPLAAEPWRPDFLPAEETLSSALLWIRLPNLPIEYWSEEALRSILAVAGEFVALDPSTKGKRRGSFARAAVKVNLNRPLRPGARIRGSGSPFWQQFTYEHVEGICPGCGAIHQGGMCSSSPLQSTDPAPPRFGPWMTATRQRKQSPIAESGGLRTASMAAPASVNAADRGSGDGWLTPRKLARRRQGPSTSVNVELVSSPRLNAEGQLETLAVPVTVAKVSETLATGTKVQRIPIESNVILKSSGQKGKAQCLSNDFNFAAKAAASFNLGSGQTKQLKSSDPETVVQKEGLLAGDGSKLDSSSKIATNPFCLRGSDRWAGVPKIREDANPASSKRARPVDVISQRTLPKAVKAKGKSRAGSSTKEISGPSVSPRDSCVHDDAVSILKQAILPSSPGSEDMELSQQPVSPDRDTLSMPSSSIQELVAMTPSAGGLTDMEMLESQGGEQNEPQPDQ